MKLKLVIPLLSVIFCSVFSGFGQEIVRTTIGSIGSSMGNGTVTVQQTAGQPSAISFVKNEDGSALRQGFHQPIIVETETNELNALIFPNPNNGNFSFQVDVAENIPFDYFLMDQQGKLILKESAAGNELIPLTIAQPAPGMYHLIISSQDKSSSFKISVIR
jgi:hypothetical protein